MATPLVLALVLAGCATPEASPSSTGASPSASNPSTAAVKPSTKLSATTSGSAQVGSFQAEPGDVWVGGRCSGGSLEVRVDPVAVLPIPCQTLSGGQFLNQIVMNRTTAVTVSVNAPAAVTWELQIKQ